MGLPGPLPYEGDLVLCNTAREYTVPARGSRQSLVKVWLNRRQSAEAHIGFQGRDWPSLS